MNTEMDRPRDHTSSYGKDDPRDHPNVTGEGHDIGGDHHGEKKSMLKKVKAKAKKIKDTIKGHGGHGHDDDDDNNEMVTNPDTQGAPGVHNINEGKDGIARQHGTEVSERSAIGGHDTPSSNPGANQVFETTKTDSVPGQEETRADTGTLPGSGNQTGADRHALGIGHASHPSGNRSTGDLGVGHKPKFGGNVEKDSQVNASYPAQVSSPSGAVSQGIKKGEDATTRHHGTNTGETTAIGGHVPAAHGTNLGKTGTAKQHGINIGERAAVGGHAPASEPGAAAQDIGLGRGGGTAKQHLGEGATMERAHIPVSKPVEYHTFDTPVSRDIPVKDETTGRSITDSERSKLSEEQPYAPKNSPITAHQGDHHTGALGIGDRKEPGSLGVVLDREVNLERDPHDPRGVGEKPHADNYQSKVTDPTGTGGEEIGVTPIRHQLGKMDIHDGTDTNLKTGQSEHLFSPSLGHHQKTSTGSHDQFTPETMTNPQFDASTTIDQGLHEEEREPGGYTEKMSSVASELAQKAKIATGSVTSKLGYGGSQETPTNASTTPGGFDQTHEGQFMHGEEQSKTGSVGDYGKKVYEKVAELGSTVASKVQGSGAERPTGSEYDVGPAGDADKGISVKEYLVEKLKPGEEDKALSNVITEALPLHKPEENPVDMLGGDEASKVEIKGRVTESEEVARQLGRGEDTSYDGAGPGLASPGKSVMDRIMDATGSWFNTSGEPPVDSDEHAGDRGNERIQVSTTSEDQQNAGEPRVY